MKPMIIPEGIFKSYDIRGIYPSELNEETIVVIVKAIYAFFLENHQKDASPRVVLGHDMRVSSPPLFEKAKETLTSLGATVVDIGMVSTPTFYFAVYHYGLEFGIQITASHNPKDYNGIKFVRNGPRGLIKIGKSTGMEIVKRYAFEGVSLQKKTAGKIIQKSNILNDEIETALSLLGRPHLGRFKVVADAANAMGAQYILALFQKIGGELTKMNFAFDGTFPSHPPDPLDFRNLEDLRKRVVSEKADFGLAPDGDGDRLFFVDERGNVVPATIITALVASEILKKQKGAMILFDIRYIFTPAQIIKEYGGRYEITKVGHAYITEQMGKTEAVFAGESSAHYYYQFSGNAESQIATIVSVLKILTEEKKPLSAIVEELRRSFESGEINFKVANVGEIMEHVQKKYSDGELSTLDGIAISYPDWRFSLRASNTEPLIRLNVEAYQKDVMEKYKRELVDYIESVAKKE